MTVITMLRRFGGIAGLPQLLHCASGRTIAYSYIQFCVLRAGVLLNRMRCVQVSFCIALLDWIAVAAAAATGYADRCGAV